MIFVIDNIVAMAFVIFVPVLVQLMKHQNSKVSWSKKGRVHGVFLTEVLGPPKTSLSKF